MPSRSFQQRGNVAKIKMREARLNVVAKFYARGYSLTKIRECVIKELALETYSIKTCRKDIDILLKQWQEARIEDLDSLVQTELERIALAEMELWEAWDKSKSDYVRNRKKQIGTPMIGTDKLKKISTEKFEQEELNVISYGDPRYQQELTRLRDQRIKLLGLNKPERFEVKDDNIDISDLPEEIKAAILKKAREKRD